MRVLVACEFSGVVREAFKASGHDAWSCDLLPSEIPGEHIQGDVLGALGEGWDLMIAHPPCTYLSNSGVSWLHKQPGRWDLMTCAARFFRALWLAPIARICIENPIMHKHAKAIIGESQTQVVQPWQHGHKEQKSTCLWLKNLPKLEETKNVKSEMLKLPKNIRQRLHYLPPSKNRARVRSLTYPGIARAMAKQWGCF